MANEIICDACKAIIKMKRIKIKEQAIGTDEDGNKVKARTFECTNCGKRYLVALINNEMQKKIGRRRRIQESIKKATPKTRALIPAWIKEDQQLEKELLEREEELRKIWCKDG